MSRTLQNLETKLPRPKTVAEAIEMDSRLSYIPIPVEVQEQIASDPDITNATFEYDLEKYQLQEEIIQQIRRYKIRDHQNAQLIVYNDEATINYPVKAVSALFHPIPLTDVWKAAVDRLGEPIEERATNQAIIVQFAPVSTHYKKDGTITPEDYDIRPTIAFSYNFAERSFQLGFVVGVFFCTNQIFTFFGDSRIVHNIHKINAHEFTIEGAMDKLMENVTRLEELIEKAQTTPLPEYAIPVLYWRGARGQVRVLELIYEAHAKKCVEKEGVGNLTLWDGIMNITYVSTHETPNYNSAVDMSTIAGQTMIEIGKLLPDDYVRGLGWYMQHKRRTEDQYWKQELPIFQRISLIPLMNYVRQLLTELVNEAETIAEEEHWTDDLLKLTDKTIGPKTQSPEPITGQIPITYLDEEE